VVEDPCRGISGARSSPVKLLLMRRLVSDNVVLHLLYEADGLRLGRLKTESVMSRTGIVNYLEKFVVSEVS
jgi:hypothetical protein